MEFPKIKKEVMKFLLDEDAFISKKTALRLGALVGTMAVALPSEVFARHVSSTGYCSQAPECNEGEESWCWVRSDESNPDKIGTQCHASSSEDPPPGFQEHASSECFVRNVCHENSIQATCDSTEDVSASHKNSIRKLEEVRTHANSDVWN